MAAAAILGAASACLAQTNYPEIEPNETKANATVVTGFAVNDTLTGTTTGSSTTAGAANSRDTWDITTAPGGAPGVYKYHLAITGTTNNQTVQILGLTQTNGVINATEAVALNAPPTTAHFVKWYGNEQPSHVYVRVLGTSATTAPYTLTLLSQALIAPVPVPNPVDAGPVYISTIGQTTLDTDMWLYDSNFIPIVDAGNDHESTAGGGAGTTTQSRLQRNLPAGTYYLAISRANLANNLAAPADDRSRSGNVMDFPNALLTSSASSGTSDLDFEIGNRCTGGAQFITNTALFMEVSFASFTVAGTQLPDPTDLGSAAATPAAIVVGSGASTLLTVTATGGAPTSVTGDLSAFGLTAAEAFHDDGVNGDVAAADGIWSYNLAVPAAQALGAYSINVVATAPSACSLTLSRTITLNVTPANNLCVNAVPITVGGSYLGTTLGAAGAGGSSTACNTITGTNPGVWYQFTETSPTGRRLIASLCDPVTNFDATMVVYTGSCGAFTCLTGSDNSFAGCPTQNPARELVNSVHSDIPAITTWAAGAVPYNCTVPGQTYYIAVLNKVAATSGNFVLHLDDTGEPCQGLPPYNDLCTGARPLTTFPSWNIAIRDFATADADVSCNDAANTSARGSVWYTFTPTGPGNFFYARIPDLGSADPVITVFAASPDCSNLTEVACVGTVETYVNRFTTPVAALSAGTTYYIELSQKSATTALARYENMGFNFVATGPGPCCRSDYNGDGDVGTDADIESFFACLSGVCCATCPPNADFNCDGDNGTDADIESFFRVLAGGAC
jgi:hypothetical protein